MQRELSEAKILIDCEKRTLLGNKKSLEEKLDERNETIYDADKDKQGLTRTVRKLEQDLKEAQSYFEALGQEKESVKQKQKIAESQIHDPMLKMK